MVRITPPCAHLGLLTAGRLIFYTPAGSFAPHRSLFLANWAALSPSRLGAIVHWDFLRPPPPPLAQLLFWLMPTVNGWVFPATIVRLFSINAINAYLTSWALALIGEGDDARMLLPAWIFVASVCFFFYPVLFFFLSFPFFFLFLFFLFLFPPH